MRYSLADYIVTFKSNDPEIDSIIGSISLGGQGSSIGTISLSGYEIWSVNGFATGAWIHTKSYNRSGTCQVSLSQMDPAVEKLIQLANSELTGDHEGMTITITSAGIGSENARIVANCVDCHIQGDPGRSFNESAGTPTWTFVCGQINYR